MSGLCEDGRAEEVEEFAAAVAQEWRDRQEAGVDLCGDRQLWMMFTL